MTLAAKLAFYFEKRTQVMGRGLFLDDAVNVTSAGPAYLHAEVYAGRSHDVHLTFQDRNLRVACECGYFRDSGECKHLWAAILEADKRGALTEAANAAYIILQQQLSGRTAPSVRSDYGRRLIQTAPVRQVPAWEEHLSAIQRGLQQKRPETAGWPREFEIQYVIDVSASKSSGAIVLELMSRSRKKNGEWTVLKEFRINAAQTGSLPDPVDVEAITAMFGGQESYAYMYAASTSSPARKALPPVLALKLIRLLAPTGRLVYRNDIAGKIETVAWDDGEPWKLWLEVRQDDRDQWTIAGALRRGPERMDLAEPSVILQSGLLLAHGRLARFDEAGVFAWVHQLRIVKRIPFPDRERDTVLARLLESPQVPPMDVDEALQFEQRRVQPRMGLRVTQHREPLGEEQFRAHLLLDYGRGWTEDKAGNVGGVWLPEERVFLARDEGTETKARATLEELGLRPEGYGGTGWRLNSKSMPRVVRELVRTGWHVEAEGKAFRRPGETRVDVRSGIDWFELHAEVDYGGATATLPQLLAARRRGDTMVRLGDGSFGLLPEEWLQRFAPLAGLGSDTEDHLRFQRNQAGLLDALLASQPEVRVDEVFERARERMRSFEGVKAAAQPAGFVGQLRDYQREGLGWMEFLREFGFGGCLADDMGVGKTAQVLAVLETRRLEGKGPSLVVAPKSLMFNWRAESARFTPQLRVLDHTGLTRDTELIAKHDMILTTYGTLLRDAAALSEIEFDYVVLDEAQAVKNASTASAKAVRLLRGQHRLALSGTPVENHLGELWSLFEFLNPGMLGEAKVLKMAGGLARNPSEEARRLLAHALRPFILRRTKRQVARELPEKTEQTIFCELEGPQRKQYDELRAHYRETLLQRVKTDGLGKSKMHVLEALLRLRQAACHPGLLDPKLCDQPSAKLDVLMDQLEELREEGHKALVFSQFTSLLAIVRSRLDAAGVRYEYLDGSTRDRQSHVETFQNDPDCGLFLISLKAGGLGLNLTAAEYVFLLDPWWNPAVEAQAVDRAHRIGQTRQVFAYRLIARETVEEKVLELQKTKRDLADAILGEDNSLIRDLNREDLELLLS
jgi:hypothetical protein